ncbi:MAG: hypothetical protein II612_00710 [Prevotella sp.]|nr:hypothetical protein [Prevotella sp.]
MPSFKKMEMADAISKHIHVQIEKSFLGMRTNIVYQPTQSLIDCYIQDYTAETGAKIERILKTPVDKMAEAIRQAGPLPKANISNMRLELCLSRDHQFAAAQLFSFYDFKYHAATDVIFIEGEQADILKALV